MERPPNRGAAHRASLSGEAVCEVLLPQVWLTLEGLDERLPVGLRNPGLRASGVGLGVECAGLTLEADEPFDGGPADLEALSDLSLRTFATFVGSDDAAAEVKRERFHRGVGWRTKRGRTLDSPAGFHQPERALL